MPAHGSKLPRLQRLTELALLVCCFVGIVGCKSQSQFKQHSVSSSLGHHEPFSDHSGSLIELVQFEDDDDPKAAFEIDDNTDSDTGEESDADSSTDSKADKDRADKDRDAEESESPEQQNSDDASQAATPQAPPDQLDSLIATALATHPRIAAARQTVAASAQRIAQVKALPNPTLGNTFWPIHDQALQTAGGRVGHQFALSQQVPWPTKLDARANVAARQVHVAQAEISKTKREVVEAVRLAYYELWLADELIRIFDDNKELVMDLITISEARYKTGGSQQDVLRAELEGDKLDDQLIDLIRQKEQAQADLGVLVRQPIHLMPVATEALDVSEIVPQLEQLIANSHQCNPILQGLAAQIAHDRAKETLACAQKYPDLQFGMGYSIVSDDTNVISPVANGHDNINFTVGVSLPIWQDKINAGIREAAHTTTSTMNRREAERDKLHGQLRRQVAAVDAAMKRLSLYRERLIPRTEKTLEIATADYIGKKADFTDLINIYQELLGYRVQVARTKAALASMHARIERAVGCDQVYLQ